MRLFAAIDLDDAARAAIADEQTRLKRRLGRADRSLRWARPEQMHLTLVFIGNVDDERGPAIVKLMSGDIAAKPFAMSFARLGVFPPHRAPSVLWLGVAEGASEAIELQRIVAERLEQAAVPREHRLFHPHLTLARWRASKPSDRGLVLEAGRDAEVARVEVAFVTLYQSHLSPSGSTYAPLARAALGA
jgi:RNA 2',3'-cyclic 3'-phosphodiesterase